MLIVSQTTIPVNKTCTEAMPFLGHAKQEAYSIRTESIIMSLPKDLHPVAKNVPIPSECLFGDYINARVINIKTQQKAFKVNQT